ncbi:polysaccharide deacetylase family protein [Brevibacillus invocatus]|uniref:polysaccharide deacetylase family protein n=1 Tax=Brevibacillus invocatus TaxID=173959 RepID=UPI00203B0621|nr:polysaccharide deacetylase family protein [Brevibacillus invocatus]MCM3078079.1 polysaccharide deacetylase family protein [Brevibacillus invocatus]MCM3428335.1 polysaccharide deacetylase family protein [Brevibacillus invocatus]
MKRQTNTTKTVILALLLTACSPFSTENESAQAPPVAQSEEPLPQTPPAEKNPFELAVLIDLARDGKIPHTSFVVTKTTMDEVEQAWGQPDKLDQVGGNLQRISRDQIMDMLGEAEHIRKLPNETVLSYSLDESLSLRFILSDERGRVDHVSLLASADQGADPSASIPETYDLAIKGESNQLSTKAKQNMDRWRNEIRQFASKHRDEVYINGPNKKQVALTFDDGPDATVTPAIIRTLDQYGIKGSFFFVGSRVKENPEVVQLAEKSGHLVLGHSYLHEDLTTKNLQGIAADLIQTENEIEQVIGKKPALLRPPFGETDEQVVKAAKQNGNTIILWSIDTLDWSQKEAENIRKNVMDNVRNGDIILMHSNEDKSETANAVPMIISELQQQGFEIVGLDTLLGVKPYK